MNKTRKALSVLLAAALFLSLSAGLAGCQKGQVAASASPNASADTKISVTDSRGKTVELDKPAEKIVCLLNSGLNDLEMISCAVSLGSFRP